MPNFIEPNIHPMLVHFAYALTVSAALLFLIVIFIPGGKKFSGMKSAADWMLALGAIAVIGTVAAGFQAFYSVDHDIPSHASMLVHRNLAVAAGSIVLVLALWRLVARKSAPSKIFGVSMLISALLISVTAWWGGKLVYEHGLGVASLPVVAGDGHDHEHGEHDTAPEKTETMVKDTSDSGIDMTSATSVVDGFQDALKAGDKALVERLMAPGVIIAEGGNAEWSFSEYRDHHMEADMAQTGSSEAVVERTVHRREIIESGDSATVITHSQLDGDMGGGKEFHYRMMETMVVTRTDGEWRISHIHWSAAPIKDKPKAEAEAEVEDEVNPKNDHNDDDHEH